jgi:hypothetical protein
LMSATQLYSYLRFAIGRPTPEPAAPKVQIAASSKRAQLITPPSLTVGTPRVGRTVVLRTLTAVVAATMGSTATAGFHQLCRWPLRRSLRSYLSFCESGVSYSVTTVTLALAFAPGLSSLVAMT